MPDENITNYIFRDELLLPGKDIRLLGAKTLFFQFSLAYKMEWPASRRSRTLPLSWLGKAVMVDEVFFIYMRKYMCKQKFILRIKPRWS